MYRTPVLEGPTLNIKDDICDRCIIYIVSVLTQGMRSIITSI